METLLVVIVVLIVVGLLYVAAAHLPMVPAFIVGAIQFCVLVGGVIYLWRRFL